MRHRAVVQVHFARERGQTRPVAVTKALRMTGPRTTIEVDHEALSASSIFVLYRLGVDDLVLAGSRDRDVIEAARKRLGRVATSYEIASVPVLPAVA